MGNEIRVPVSLSRRSTCAASAASERITDSAESPRLHRMD